MSTKGLDATGGHPQSSPRFVWALVTITVAMAIPAVATNLEIVFFIFIFVVLSLIHRH
jgi:hypothetical protein